MISKVLIKNFLRKNFNGFCLHYYKFLQFKKKIYLQAKGNSKLSFPYINQFNYKPKSDTLFILGSGNSVNKVTLDQWNIIKKHDSVGFNAWMIHDFVPDFYMFEPAHNPLNLSNAGTRIFLHNFSQKGHLYQNVPIIFKMNTQLVKNLFLEEIPDCIKSNIYLSPVLFLPYHDKQSFKLALKNASKRLNKSKNLIHFHAAASVFDLIIFGYKIGFQKIVMVGVDLTTKYFYEEESIIDNIKKYNILLPEAFKRTGNIHATEKNSVPISTILDEVDRELLAPKNIKLYVASKASRLYPRFQCYF